MSGKNKKVSDVVKNNENAVVESQANGSESTKETVSTVKVVVFDEPAQNPEYSNREWLEKNVPAFSEDVVSKKYDSNREPSVQGGLKAIETLGIKINPLTLLLAKWWEVKPARAEIKKMIDAEAQGNSIPEDVYIQGNLRKEVEILAEVQSAVDRLRYSINYYKPRTGINIKDIFKPMSILGKVYKVNLRILEETKAKFGTDIDAIRTFMIENSEEITANEL